MSRVHDTGHPPLPPPPAGPSEELQARAREGMARFLASVPTHDDIRPDAADRPQQGR